MSGAGVKKMTRAEAVGRGAENGVGSGSHRNGFEWEQEILLLLLRLHALVRTIRLQNGTSRDRYHNPGACLTKRFESPPTMALGPSYYPLAVLLR